MEQTNQPRRLSLPNELAQTWCNNQFVDASLAAIAHILLMTAFERNPDLNNPAYFVELDLAHAAPEAAFEFEWRTVTCVPTARLLKDAEDLLARVVVELRATLVDQATVPNRKLVMKSLRLHIERLNKMFYLSLAYVTANVSGNGSANVNVKETV